MAANEDRVSRFLNVFNRLAETASERERTRIVPNALVINSAPADLPAEYIIVESEEGFYVPAVKVPGVVYANDDKVNLLYIKGTEPIAFQHGSGSPSGGAGGYPFNIITVDTVDVDAAHSTIAAAIAAASAGDIILVGPGTYSENIDISKAITIMAFELSQTTVTSSASETVDITAVGAKLQGFTVENTGTGAFHACIQINANNCIIESCSLVDTGAATEKVGIYHLGGTGAEIRDVRATVDAATTSRGYHGGVAASLDAKIINSFLSGATTDLYNVNANCTVELVNTQLLTDTMVFNGGTLQGVALDSQGRNAGIVVQNTSGAAADTYDIGYLDEAGEYQTTTTANDNVSWHVVSIGGSADAGFVFAKNKGQATVNYTGAAPSAGDFLVTSTTAGDAQAQAGMRPEIFAVCTAAGGGGTVETLLLANRITIPISSANKVVQINASSDSDWVSTMNGAPAGAVITYNAPLTNGNEDSIVVSSTSHLGKLVIWNTTKSPDEYAHIESVNIGANTITVTNAADISGWANTEVIRVRSVMTEHAAIKFFDVEITSAEVPELATALWLETRVTDAGSASFINLHPWSAVDLSKLRLIFTAGVADFTSFSTIELIERRFTISNEASGTGTLSMVLTLLAATVAIP